MPNLFNPSYTQPNYQQPYAPTYTSYPQNNSHNTSVVWVQGLAGAQAYPVGAGNTVMLMDSEDSVFYMKSTDITGRPLPLRIFEFKERINGQSQQQVDLTNYVTWDAFEKRLDEIESHKRKENSNAKSNKKSDEQQLF